MDRYRNGVREMAHHNTVRLASDRVEYLEPQRIQSTLEHRRDESRSLHGLLEHAQDELELSLEDGEEHAFGIQRGNGKEQPHLHVIAKEDG